jgi:predicted RNA-binding protein YlxR (DUF448 family)
MKKRRLTKIPYRTCIGCQEKKPKRELLRIIRTPEGEIEIDETGKKSGRGAYLCYNKICFQEAIKKKRLGKALKTDIAPLIVKELEEKFNLIEEDFVDN